MKDQKEFNRTLSFDFKINKTTVQVSVLHNKYNTTLEYLIDENKDINSKVIRNLNKSDFAQKYLELSDSVNEECVDSCSNKLYNTDVKPVVLKSKNGTYRYLDEMFDMAPAITKPELQLENTNYLAITGYGLKKLNNNFLFVFFERTRFIKSSDKLVTRTAAIQLWDKKTIYIE